MNSRRSQLVYFNDNPAASLHAESQSRMAMHPITPGRALYRALVRRQRTVVSTRPTAATQASTWNTNVNPAMKTSGRPSTKCVTVRPISALIRPYSNAEHPEMPIAMPA